MTGSALMSALDIINVGSTVTGSTGVSRPWRVAAKAALGIGWWFAVITGLGSAMTAKDGGNSSRARFKLMFDVFEKYAWEPFICASNS